MKKVEWLLSHYYDLLNRKSILQAENARLHKAETIKTNEEAEIISESVKGSIVPNEISRCHSATSRTETAAISYKEKAEKSLQEQSLELIREIQQLDFFIHLCEDLVNKQSRMDRWLLTARYIEKQTFEAMLLSQPAELKIYSRQTMSKHCKNLINRLESYLQGVDVSSISF